MKRQPDAVFIVDLRKEQLALREAQRLSLPVIALVDTNCDPDEVTYVVPGNDDAIRSCSLVVRAIAEGIAEASTKVTEVELTRGAEQAPASEPETTPEAAETGEQATPAGETRAKAAEQAAPASETEAEGPEEPAAAETPEAVGAETREQL
jgi:small subunit ribosomal protein S2